MSFSVEPLSIVNRLPVQNPANGVRLGLVRAVGLSAKRYPTRFENELEEAVAAASKVESLHPERRAAARDMLRNGRYKPTGRGKPASEYLLRAAGEQFPRINAPVDVTNLLSLAEQLPISLWDVERVPAPVYAFRLGRSGETYDFNAAGQQLDVEDLAVGCRLVGREDEDGIPIVSPIKDSQAAKTADSTHSVVACVYAPVNAVSELTLNDICARFASLLSQCGDDVATATAVASPGAEVRL